LYRQGRAQDLCSLTTFVEVDIHHSDGTGALAPQNPSITSSNLLALSLSSPLVQLSTRGPGG